MSRKKKATSQPGAPKASSFRKIRKQIKKKHANSMPLTWFETSKNIYRFPYRNRHPILLDVCGTYEIRSKIPKSWSQIILKGLGSSDKKVREFSDILLNITEEEFRTGVFENKKFNDIRKRLGIKKKDLSKPKLVDLIKHMSTETFLKFNHTDILDILKKERIRNVNTKVYISCDPWDIARMGVGKVDMGSCVNFLSGGNTNMLFCNFQDSNAVIAYIEDDKDHLDIDGMRCRAMVRLLKSNGEYGIALDKLYGNKSYGIVLNAAIKMAAEKAKVNVWKYKEYNHSGTNNHHISQTGARKLIAASPINSYRNGFPYLDQQRSGEWLEFDTSKQNKYGMYTFEMVEE